MIQVFEQAITETRQLIERKRATGQARHAARAETMQTSLTICIERLTRLPEELQCMIAYQLQHHNGGYLHLDSEDAVWRLIERYTQHGERFHSEPMPYKSLR